MESFRETAQNYRTENSKLLLESEKQRSDILAFKKLLQNNPTILFTQIPSKLHHPSVLFSLSVNFHQSTEFSWSHFGVELSDVTGLVTILEVKNSSVFHEVLKPKFRILKIDSFDVKTLAEMKSKLRGKRLSCLNFTISSPPSKLAVDKSVQTVFEYRLPRSNRESNRLSLQAGHSLPSRRSPFTRNSTLRSPLPKYSNETLSRCAGMSALKRKRHRSYSPSMDLHVNHSPGNFCSVQSAIFDMSPRHQTFPRNSSNSEGFQRGYRRSATPGTEENELLFNSNATLSEEDTDNLFDGSLFEIEDDQVIPG